MGDHFMADEGADYSITARQNCSLTPRQRLGVFVLIAFFPLLVASFFMMHGAWMVMPFAGLELIALAFGFYWVHCHSYDYESLTINNNKLAIEQRCFNKICRIEFQCYWARVILRDAPGGDQKLLLRSHGKEVEFGRYLNNEARLILAEQLKRRTGFVF